MLLNYVSETTVKSWGKKLTQSNSVFIVVLQIQKKPYWKLWSMVIGCGFIEGL